MNFNDIVQAVCKDGIGASRQADAKNWIIGRHAMLWGAAPWTFKQTQAPITFTANQQQAASPADVHGVYAIYDKNGDPLRGERDLRRFFDFYNTLAQPSAGSPEAYTIVDSTIFVGPKGDGSTGLIVYEKEKPALVNDLDSTGLPAGFELALVYGARATGYALTNAGPMAQEYEQMFDAQIAALANDWLDKVLETGGQTGAYRPGRQSPAWR